MELSDPRIKERIISPADSILAAFKQMDAIYQKLLLILDNGFFYGLVSIGDIQRAIIKNEPLDAPISSITRKDIKIASTKTPAGDIRKEMLKYRMEFIPVVDEANRLANVIFWEDIFTTSEKRTGDKMKIDAPVVIMAGGKGIRLRPITNVIPKPLIPLKDKPIIEKIIDNFMETGIHDFIISVNYKAEYIKFHFGQIPDKKFTVSYIQENEPLGTAGCLNLLKGQLTKTFFVTNCDILIDQDYREVWNYHKENRNELTLVSSLKTINIPYGTLKLGENGSLLALDEKPTLNFFINAGMYLIEPHLLDEIPSNAFFNMTDLIDVVKKREGRIGVFPVSEGSLIDIGSWEEYLKNI
jgi:dTDP-glucose pyrophosphorylase/CBS domain-containing protein